MGCLSWGIGIIFLLCGLSGIIAGNNLIFGVINLVAACILIPPVWNYIEDAFDFKLKTLMKASIVILIVIIQIGAGIWNIYQLSTSFVDSLKSNCKEEPVKPSEIIQNAPANQKRDVIYFSRDVVGSINFCIKAQKTYKNEPTKVINSCKTSYIQLKKINIPSSPPHRVRVLLDEAKTNALDLIMYIIELDSKPKTQGLSELANFMQVLVPKYALTFKKLHKVMIIMRIEPKMQPHLDKY